MSKIFSKIFFSKIKTNLILGHFSPFLAILGMVLVKICQKNCKNFSKFFFSKSKQSSFLAILALFRPFSAILAKIQKSKISKMAILAFFGYFRRLGLFLAIFSQNRIFCKSQFLAIFGYFRRFALILTHFRQFWAIFAVKRYFRPYLAK